MPLNLIRKNNQTNVTAYHDAVIFHQAKGKSHTGDYNGSVFQGVYNEFGYKFDIASRKFILKSGMGMLYGRQFELPDNEEYEIDISSLTGQKYVSIYVEIDTRDVTNETIIIKAAYGSSDYPILSSGNLYQNKQGVATMELYRIYYNALYPSNARVYTRFNFYVPGEAETARSLDKSALIYGKRVDSLIIGGTNCVYNANHATYSDTTYGLREKKIVSDDLKLSSGFSIPQVLLLHYSGKSTVLYNENTTSVLAKVAKPTLSVKCKVLNYVIALKAEVWHWGFAWLKDGIRTAKIIVPGILGLEEAKLTISHSSTGGPTAATVSIVEDETSSFYKVELKVNDNMRLYIEGLEVYMEVAGT